MPCILDFGKYAGKDVTDPKQVPDSYLLWICDQETMSPSLRELCRRRRGLEGPPPKRDDKPRGKRGHPRTPLR